MTGHTHDTTNDDAINTLLQSGLFEGIPLIAEMLANAAMILERAHHLKVGAYERGEARNGQANGFKPRGLQTSFGKLALNVPQVRDSSGPFHSSLFEQGSRTDRSLKVAIAEMYLQGVSTRRVTTVMEKLCGMEVTSCQVSRLTSELDVQFELWRNRPLPEIAFLILDATYLKVRINGAVRDCAVFTAIGIRRSDGKRMALGVSAEISEAEPHWRAFINTLKARGIGIPDLVTSDAHEGLKAALRATLPSTPWQRCQFHLQQNAQAYVPQVAMRASVAADIRSIFNSEDLAHAEEGLARLVVKYGKTAPALSAWMETAIPEGLTVMVLAESLRKRLRTSNMCENLNLQIKRRTRVIGLFPNENSVLRLVTAILMEASEEWETGKSYLTLTAPHALKTTPN
jgi:transposase-like protein